LADLPGATLVILDNLVVMSPTYSFANDKYDKDVFIVVHH